MTPPVTLIEEVAVLRLVGLSDELSVLEATEDVGLEDVDADEDVDANVEVAPRPYRMKPARPVLLAVLVRFPVDGAPCIGDWIW